SPTIAVEVLPRTTFTAAKFQAVDPWQAAEKSLSQAAQKDPEARRAINRRAEAYLSVRCSEAIERNEAYGSFSAACQIKQLMGCRPGMLDLVLAWGPGSARLFRPLG